MWMHFSICGAAHESKLHENINTFDQKYAPISFLRAGLRECFLGGPYVHVGKGTAVMRGG